MTSTCGAFRAAVVVLVLATAARAFVLSPTRVAPGFSSSSGRHSLHHTPTPPPTASRTASVRSSSRRNGGGSSNISPLSCPLNSRPGACFAGCTAPLISSAAREAGAAGGFARRSSRMTMGMGMASCALSRGGRKLAMVGLLNAAAFATVGGGVLAGGLHAVSGPDHLAALLPRIMGQKWHNSMRIGATWGLGHGFSATVIGLAAFFFKDRMGLGTNDRLVSIMGTWTEGLVGVSLIAIGLLGLKESLLDYHGPPKATEVAGGGSPQSVGAAGVTGVPTRGSGRAIFLNGVLHGFSWDGAPSLAPALALSSWGSVLWFLLAYCSGTMVAMSATTTVIGEGSLRVGKALDQPDIPRKLSVVSSFVAITIGAIWLAKAVLF